MGVINTDKFGFDEVKKKLQNQTSNANDKKIERWLSYIGEDLCNDARTVTKGHSSGGYDDQTGNLRSSIGYRIYKDGVKVKDGGFANVTTRNTKGKTVTGNGIKEAKAALDKYGLAYEIPIQGWTLVIVAGMSYATYVESKGFNVLHLTKEKMRIEIEGLKNKLGL